MMPLYGSAAKVPYIVPHGEIQVFVAADGNATASTASQQVAIQRPYGAASGSKFVVELAFSGAPGTFEVDVQGAVTDVAAAYNLIGGADSTQQFSTTSVKITAVNSGNYATFDFETNLPFIRVAIVSITNSVTLICTLRMAG